MKKEIKTDGVYMHLLSDKSLRIKDIYLTKGADAPYGTQKEIISKTKVVKINTFPNYIL